MSDALDHLVDNLQLEQLDTHLFRGTSLDETRSRVYGGQVLGQAIVAAGRTVEAGYLAHSLNSYFVRAGDTRMPVTYQVDPVRDGRSFITRRVTAQQKDRPIFDMGISFQKPEVGFEHQTTMPDVPGPEGLPTEEERRLQFIAENGFSTDYDFAWPIEFRHVDPVDFAHRETKAPVSYVWLRANGTLNDDPRLHQEILGYASDSPILITSCRPHAEIHAGNALIATLDHSLWFHRPFRADEWLLYAMESPSASNGRGFVRGSLFNQAGVLVASATQEGVIRVREDGGQLDLIGDPTGFKR